MKFNGSLIFNKYALSLELFSILKSNVKDWILTSSIIYYTFPHGEETEGLDEARFTLAHVCISKYSFKITIVFPANQKLVK